MKPIIVSLVAGLTVALAGCNDTGSDSKTSSEPIEAVPPPAGGDWTQVVTETTEGGYLMGNPNARVKLVEYASYSCPHCAEFSETGSEPLQTKYVKTGQVSWEFRPFLLFPTDPGIGMLVRCQGPQASFLLTDQLYAQQREWMASIQQQAEQLQAVPVAQRPAAFIRAGGLDQFFRQRGMPETKIESCLADQAGLNKLVEITDRAVKEFRVQGTPTFFINGEQVENAGTWEALEPKIREAL